MHSNFITPPDIVQSILIIDADKSQIEECAIACKSTNRAYNVYFYHADMAEVDWLARIINKADYILQQEDSQVPILVSTKFGPNSVFKSPADYFNK